MGRTTDFWTAEKDQILRDFYPTTSAPDICKKFGWKIKPTRLSTRANFMGIKKEVKKKLLGAEVKPFRTEVQQGKGYRIVTHRMAY